MLCSQFENIGKIQETISKQQSKKIILYKNKFVEKFSTEAACRKLTSKKFIDKKSKN